MNKNNKNKLYEENKHIWLPLPQRKHLHSWSRVVRFFSGRISCGSSNFCYYSSRSPAATAAASIAFDSPSCGHNPWPRAVRYFSGRVSCGSNFRCYNSRISRRPRPPWTRVWPRPCLPLAPFLPWTQPRPQPRPVNTYRRELLPLDQSRDWPRGNNFLLYLQKHD